MDIFTKKRSTSWIIILLVLLNFFTLAMLWYSHLRQPALPPPPPGGGERPAAVQHFLERELGLTEEQSQKFKKMREKHFFQSKAILDESHQLKERINAELFASVPDAAKVERLAAEIGEKQADLEKLRFSHFSDLMSECEPGQRERFKSLLHELLRMTGPPKAPPPGKNPPIKRIDDRQLHQ